MKNNYPILSLAKRGCYLLLSAIVLGGCASHEKSYAIKGEKVEVNMLEQRDQEGILGPLLGLLVPQVINWGVTGTQTLINKQAAKYTAEYSGSISGSDFYVVGGTDNGLLQKYSGFEFLRNADILNSNGAYTSTLSSHFIFDFDLNPERTFMSLNPKQIAVNYTKAKLSKNDENLDVLVSVSISSTWVDDRQSFNKKEIASFEFRFSDIVLGELYDKNSPQIKHQQNNWFPLPPVSLDSENKPEDYGYFDIYIKVIETDDYGKRLEKYSNTINSNSDLINALLNKLVE